MTITNTSTIEPWMTELWTWADKFDISVENLPRNQDDLLEITDLNIGSNQLTYLPDSIGQLKNLEKLTICCSELKRIPETIGYLTGLNELILKCKNLERLPESLAQITQLRGLDIPSRLFSELPISIIEKYRDEELWLYGLPITALYTTLAEDYCLSEFGFFLMDNDWDEQSLLNLKYKTGAHFLFGLQTTDQCIDKIDVIDGIIVCESDEVQQVMKVSEAILSARGRMVAMDYGDIRRALQFTKPAHFIQACALGIDKLDRAERAGNQLINQIPKDISIKNLIIRIKSNCDLSLDEMVIISTAVENRVIEDKEVWYDIEVIDKPECCWIEAIYMIE